MNQILLRVNLDSNKFNQNAVVILTCLLGTKKILLVPSIMFQKLPMDYKR